MARIKATTNKPKLQTFTVVECRSHSYTAKVQARTAEEALEIVNREGEFEDQGLDMIEPSLIVVHDEEGEQVYEEIP